MTKTFRPDRRHALSNELLSDRGCSRKQYSGVRSIRAWLFRNRLELSRLLYATWLEICSLGHRILFLRSIIAGQYPLLIGEAYESAANGTLAPNMNTSARIRGILLLQGKYPWVTLVDSQVFLLGWSLGEESATRASGTSHSCSEQVIANRSQVGE